MLCVPDERPAVRRAVLVGCGYAALIAAAALTALPAQAADRLAPMCRSSADARPIGWLDFCTQNPRDCAGGPTAARDVVLTSRRGATSCRSTPGSTTRSSDDRSRSLGVVEKWSYPDDGYGDCEDYVLLKRRMLLQAGWPREALLITVVRDRKDEGHAILTVKTDKGDFVLDNQAENVALWSDTGYRFVKRQSQSDPNVWVSLGDPHAATATATAR